MRCGYLLLAGALGIVPLSSEAQVRPGYTDVGPTIGLGNLGEAGLALGGRFEHVFKRLPDLGNGSLGLQAGIDFWNYSERFSSRDYDFNYVAISGTLNYHFNVESNPKIDPFIGVGLMTTSANTEYSGPLNDGLEIVGRAGLRYFPNPNLAFYADAGAGGATINAGVMFRLKGSK